ncbi:hypothetical protein [Streptomyces sp. NPDC000351]|uniref:hypothetical protein n=1 Tax=Streptomyces sp. NPDC000351 TaxID=3154250 RepID=UPI00332653A7
MRFLQHSPHGTQGSPLTPKRLAIAIALTLTLTACDDQSSGLSYDTPDNICGIPANKNVLKSLLDDGNKLKQDTGYFNLMEGQFCHMYVDGNDSVVSDAAWHGSDYDLRDLFQDYDLKGVRYIKGGTYASWHRGVATVISCPGVSNEGNAVSVEVRDMKWNEESQPLLERLAPSYFDAYKEKLGCPS